MHNISDKNITLTPLNLISKIGSFDLDPCGLQFHKTATKIISLPDDGLVENWTPIKNINQSNRRWDFLKEIVSKANTQPVIIEVTETTLDVTFQY